MQSPILLAFIDKPNATGEQLWQASILCLRLGYIPQSMTFAFEAVKKEPDWQARYNSYYLYALKLAAEFYEEIGNYTNTMFYWEQVTKQTPQNMEAWHGLAVAKANLGDFGGAELALGQALRIEPQNQKLRKLLSEVQAHRT